MKVNNNRKIKLYLSDDTSKDWRSNISRIMTGQSDRSGTKLFNFDKTDVNNGIDLIMAEAPKSPSTNNSYSTPVKSVTDSLSKNNIVNVATSIATYGINMLSAYTDIHNLEGQETGRTAEIFQPWSTNVKAWAGDKSAGISFKYTFKFSMGQYGLWNAKEEVVKPIFNLIAPAFPQYLSDMGMAGPFPSSAELLLSLFTGTSIDTISKGFEDSKEIVKGLWTTTTTDEEGNAVSSANSGSSVGENIGGVANKILETLKSVATALTSIIQASYKNRTYTIEFGNMFKFENMLITDASTTFSNEVDQNGYPVSGTAELTFVGLVPLALLNNTSMGQSQMFPSSTAYGGGSLGVSRTGVR